MFVARDDEALECRIPGPMLLHRDGHRGGGLARADHECSARRRMGEVTRKDLERIGRGDRGLKAQCEQLFRIHASTLAQVGGGPGVLYAPIISSIDLNKPLSGSLTWSSTVK